VPPKYAQHKVFLLTGVTRNGPGGVGVALAAEVEVGLAFVYATILPHKMVERSAADLANLQKHGDAIHMDAQFTAGTQNGQPGGRAASHVMEGCKVVLDHAPIPRQQTKDDAAGDQRTNGEDATRTSAQVTYIL